MTGDPATGDPVTGAYIRAAPAAAIRPLLARRYIGFVEDPDATGSWVLPPTPTVTVIVNLGATFGGLPATFVAGMETTCTEVERAAGVTCLDLKLTPLGAYTILGLPLSEVTDRTVGLGDLVGRAGDRLVEQVAAAPDWRSRFDLVDAFLRDRADRGPEPAPAVVEACRRLTAMAGRVPIRELAAELGWSQKHLITTFKRQVGVPPKTLARIVRFQALLARLRPAERVSWAQLATEGGYYDQAHLHRDFREFAGTTPGDYLRARSGAAAG